MNQVKHVKHCQTIESEQISDQISIVPSIFPGVVSTQATSIPPAAVIGAAWLHQLGPAALLVFISSFSYIDYTG